MNKTLLSLYGLKWNPFSPELPAEALRLTPTVENFKNFAALAAADIAGDEREAAFATTADSGTGP